VDKGVSTWFGSTRTGAAASRRDGSSVSPGLRSRYVPDKSLPSHDLVFGLRYIAGQSRFSVVQQHEQPGQRCARLYGRNLRASACETLLRGPLAAQYYYVYAMDERGGEWKGKAFMCTRDREFRIDGRDDCFAHGYDRTGFFEIDTGRDAKNWTVQLTDPTPTPPAQ
jgi:hypothetical protein